MSPPLFSFFPGITPAHAGKSGRSGAHWCDREDHPRTRGEKRFRLTTRVISPWITPAHAGKSPRCGFIGNSPWDTPAHAGKRLSAVCPDVRHGDHPRTRGEKLNSSLDGLKILGSPPHTRGKAVFRGSIAPGAGITPAHAGKSRFSCSIAPGAGITPAYAGKRCNRQRNS